MVVRILEPTNPNGVKLFGDKDNQVVHPKHTKYPHFYDIRDEVRSQFWVADEVDMTSDVKQFPNLSEAEQDAFLKIIGLLATLDAPQTDLAEELASLSTDPSVKAVMSTIADQETEHNKSYSYVLASVTTLDKQIESFELGRTDEVLLRRNAKIVEVYNEFVKNPTIENTLKAMVYTSLLEGMYFYSAFAYFYNLARQQKMIGTSTMISFINREQIA